MWSTITKGKNMKKYEYKIIDIDEVGMPENEYVNLLGMQGWELMQVFNEPHHYCPVTFVKFYFRRLTQSERVFL